MPYDLIIRNGKIIDGSGIPGFHGDVAISGGCIAEIGQVNGDARRVLDADGLVVAPGIIDNHTHYDALGSPLYVLLLSRSHHGRDR